MTEATVTGVGSHQADDQLPPPGTAIVRPLRHVHAVRDRYLQRFASPAEMAASRSARAWAWALGETAAAPVTDRQTAIPPGRAEIETEIAAADERRLRGDRENRADAAATVLRWLIGDDDRVPVRCDNPGELVGGFGDIVRSREQIVAVFALATHAQQRAVASGRDLNADADDRWLAQQDADYLDGVAATLAWALGEQPEAPITRTRSRELTTRALKTERVYAQDVIEQSGRPWITDRLPPPSYGQGVKLTITWLLGDSTALPVDPTGCDLHARTGWPLHGPGNPRQNQRHR
jgi:hypothetical protein